jgi:hypothetical protein
VEITARAGGITRVVVASRSQKVAGSMAEASQKLDREGPVSRLCFIQNGRTGGVACRPWPARLQNTQSLAVQGQIALWVP